MDDKSDWRPFPEPQELNGDLAGVLASVDSLQRAWEDVIRLSEPEEFAEARRRSLRRHAIETGIIERLYDVDWGVTEALVAEGLSAEVAAREGGLGEAALETIRSQFEALEFVAATATDQEALTVSFIRQLHALVCRTQATYTAKDQFGRLVERPLRHGAWKEQPNHAVTRTGQVVQFAPPEQVQPEVERLVQLEQASRLLHPVTRAAWLHFAFVSIHPFDDGNGRVARALALLVLLRSHYAPLVVDRFSREDYIAALEEAGNDDLRALVRLFARLEVVALRAELERPAVPAASLPIGPGAAVSVARAYVERLRALRDASSVDRSQAVELLAHELTSRVDVALREIGAELVGQFHQIDHDAEASYWKAEPPDERSKWWGAQVIRAARRGGFFANLTGGTWWAYLRLTVLGQQLRYVVVTQKVGRGETGVLAVTVFAESVPVSRDPDTPAFTPLLDASDDESVTFVYSDDAGTRWPEVADVIDRTLAAAVARFAEALG